MAKEKKIKEVKKSKPVKDQKEKRHFFKDLKAEMKKVIWPTSKQLFNNTLAVITIVVIIGVIVFLLDLCFEKINEKAVEGLKTAISTTEENTTNDIDLSNVTVVDGAEANIETTTAE